ncbi:TonB-dependent receptor domain-containing protein [Horticoccus sp. 23ND18S-11]|uniref:TonB-dependent receptor domain-containing protein n=1 Tax=Horticoccus sp. 23ND18S-11 TaxID=3391832 RepID=UPI0039C9C5EC
MSEVPNYVRAASFFSNQGEGRSYGGELAATWQTTVWWRLHGQVSIIAADLREPANALTGQVSAPKLSAPRHQASLRSTMEPSRRVDFDGWLSYVDPVTATGASAPGVNAADNRIPSYLSLNLRLAWHPHRQLEISLVGKNLFGSHQEFAPTFVSTSMTEVARSVFGKVTWKF